MRESLQGFEPAAGERFDRFLNTRDGRATEAEGQSAALHSIAISLKRLADVAEWYQTAILRGEI